MNMIFLKILDMSITASWLIITVILLRFLIRKAPKRLPLLLWAFVAIRLLCPFSFESDFSFVPSAEKILQKSQEWFRKSYKEDMIVKSSVIDASNNNKVDLSSDVNTNDNKYDNLNDNKNGNKNNNKNNYDNNVSSTSTNSKSGDNNTNSINNSTNEGVSNRIQTVPYIDQANLDKNVNTSTDSPLKLKVITTVWLTGLLGILLYSFMSYLRLRRKVSISIRCKENIWLCDEISSPFVLGIKRPQIYLPSTITDEQSYYVIQHELAHVKFLDQLWKLLGFLILVIYWFNPLVWVSYILFSRDIELACDSEVVKNLDLQGKKEYSNALLTLSTYKSRLTISPVAFGEIGVKKRIKQVLNYKKTPICITAIALVLCIVVGISFFIRPKKNTYNRKSTYITDSIVRVDYKELVKNNDGNNGYDGIKKDDDYKEESNNQTTITTRSFEEVKKYLTSFPNDYESLMKAGCFIVTYDKVSDIGVWNDFCDKIKVGTPAEIVLVQFTAEGDVILDYLSYNGKQYYHVCDFSRDAFAMPGDPYYEETFLNLQVYTETADNGDEIKSVGLFKGDVMTFQQFKDTVYSEQSDTEKKVKLLVTFIAGNSHTIGEDENGEIENGEDEVEEPYDMSKVLVSKDKIATITVVDAYLEREKTFSVLDGSNTFNELINLYFDLDAIPDKDEKRIGGHYYMELKDVNGKLLQTVTPYKDSVLIDDIVYMSNKNTSTEKLYLKLDVLF